MVINSEIGPSLTEDDWWPRVHVISGATGTGKSDLAMAHALTHGAPVVVADRIQCFRDIPVTSARLDSDAASGIERIHLRNLDIPDGDYAPGDATSDLLRLVGDLTERHPLVIVEGGSISVLQRFVKPERGFQLTADVLRITDADVYWRRLRSRAERMLRPAGQVPGLLEEFSAAWRHPKRRGFVASISGFDAVVQWCSQHGVDPDSVAAIRHDDRLVASMADAVADLHAYYGMEQDGVFASLLGSLT